MKKLWLIALLLTANIHAMDDINNHPLAQRQTIFNNRRGDIENQGATSADVLAELKAINQRLDTIEQTQHTQVSLSRCSYFGLTAGLVGLGMILLNTSAAISPLTCDK